MCDLHAWISQQIGTTERLAVKAAQCTANEWEAVCSLILTVRTESDERVAGEAVIESSFHTFDEALLHTARHDPAAVLRRCVADRKILDLYKVTKQIAEQSDDPNVMDLINAARQNLPALTSVVRSLAEGYGWTENGHG
ncbi:DUF6221 family protein [Streptomyces violaceusniger]|uniref:DUF6221 family protein n=1 Tax=Streptomyces violaceusniger TaxID=68280 RepID=UPI0036BC8A91